MFKDEQWEVDHLLASLGSPPVLIDVGASAEAPRVWMPLAGHSVYVGFDPDLREMRESNGGDFRRSVIVNAAVVGAAIEQCRFFLTRSPQCSSTLRPNAQVLENYLGAEKFEVVGELDAGATTLGAALERLSLGAADWLKVDTQGTDVQVILSLGEASLDRLLAVDAEPGLRGAYVGEELFGELHRTLVEREFWLSRAEVKGFPRIREQTLNRLRDGSEGITTEALMRGTRWTPCWVECRYLRTLSSLRAEGFSKREYLLLGVFALCDDQPGFTADVAMAYESRFGADAQSKALLSAATARIRSKSVVRKRQAIFARARRKLGRLVHHLIRQ